MRVALCTTFRTKAARSLSRRLLRGKSNALEVTAIFLRPEFHAASTIASADLQYIDIALLVGLLPPSAEITAS